MYNPSDGDFSSVDREMSRNQNRTSFLIRQGKVAGKFAIEKYAFDNGYWHGDLKIENKTSAYKSLSVWDKLFFANKFPFKELWDQHTVDEAAKAENHEITFQCKPEDFPAPDADYIRIMSGTAWEMRNGQLTAVPTFTQQRATRQFTRRYSGFDQNYYFSN